MSLPLFPRLVFGQSHGRPVFPLTLRLTDNFKIWIVAKSYSFTSFSFFSEILQVYPFFFFFLGALCIALLNFIQDSNSSQPFCNIVLLLSSPSATCASLVPQPTCCWKWVGGTKGSKRAFFSLTAILWAKNGRKLKNGTFLETAVREFSENGFRSEKN